MKIVNLLIVLYIFLQPNIAVAGAARIIDADAVRNNTSGVTSLIIPATLPTASRVCVFDGSNTLAAATTTLIELGFVNGVTSSIQTQLNSKQATGNYITALTGDVSASGPGSVSATVNAVGGVTAANVATGANLANAATAANSANAIAKRDSGGSIGATNFVGSLIGNADTATNVSGIVAIANGGSGQTTANAALNAFLPSQSGNALKFLQTSGSNTSWQTVTSNPGTVTNVTATAPLSVTSPTTTPNISMTQADATHDGWLDAITWGIFNAKQPAGSYITALTGDVSASGPGSATAAVNAVGGVTASNVASSSNLANAATSANTASTIVRRDSSGNFAAGTINASITGTASNVSGIVAIANGGSGQSNQQAAINSLTNIGAATNGDVFQYLGGNAGFSSYTPPAPTGTPNTLPYYNAGGILSGIPGWVIDPTYFGIFSNQTWIAPIDAGDVYPGSFNPYVEVNTPQDTNQFHPYVGQFEMNVDSAQQNFNIQSMTTLNVLQSHRGGGIVDSAQAFAIQQSLGTGANTGTTNSATTSNLIGSIGTGYTVGDFRNTNIGGSIDGTVSGNFIALNSFYNGGGSANQATGFNLGFQVPVTNDLTLMNLNSNSTVGGNFTGIFVNSDNPITGSANLYNSYFSNAVTGNLVMSSSYVPPTASVGGDFRSGQWGDDAPVAGNAAGLLTNQNGTVTKNFTGMGAYVNADIGDGSGINAISYDASFQNHTINGQIFGFNLNNSATVVGNNTTNGLNINNSGPGYRFSGSGIFNNANFSEEIGGYKFNSQANTRTGYGLDISMQGNATDDVRGIRVNVNNQTSSSITNHVQSAEFQGGGFSVQSSVVPFNNSAVDIGNGFSVTQEIANGSPIVGTDLIQQLMQSNLILHDTIAPGPFGLGINAVGAVSQIALDSGITLPLYRGMLLGTTTPTGSGGTLTDYVALEILGLASFGGSVNNTNRVGVQDGNLIGQSFCVGTNPATNCWFLRVRDDLAENELPKLSINTSSQKVSTNVRLEVNDGHIKSTQTTPPVATVDPNAGTGGTCTVAGSDTSGFVDLETGIANAGGLQCTITFDKPYGTIPSCVFSPTGAAAALGASNVFSSTNNTIFVFIFVAAGTPSSQYTWDYHCVENN